MRRYILARRGALALFFLTVLLFNGVTLISALVKQHLIDSVTAQDLASVRVRAWTLIGCGVLQALLFVAHQVSMNMFVCKLNNDIRKHAFGGILRKPYLTFKARATSDYVSALTNDLQLLSSSYIAPLCLVLFVAVNLVGSFFLMLYYQPLIALCAMLFAVLIAVVPFLMGKLVAKDQRRRSEALSALNEQLAEAFSGFDIICSFGIQGQINRRFQACCEHLVRTEYHYYATSSFANGIGQFFSLIAQTAFLVMACYMVLVGKLSLGALVAFIGLSGSFCANFSTILQFLPAWKGSKPLIERFRALADTPADVPPSSTACLPPIRQAMTVENLSFRYGDKPILQNLTLQFKPGGKYALTGPSGCGKSTLLKLLLGWLPDYNGAIRFDGRDAKDFTPEQLRQQMSYIEQNVFLFNATIRDNITLGEAFTDEQMDKALHDSALAGDLASMPNGLDTMAGEEGSNLSGGQKQRVAIARALIHHRSILLVDEGTSALDQKNADIVEKSLLDNPELTLILVSHHLTPERKKQFTRVYDLQTVGIG